MASKETGCHDESTWSNAAFGGHLDKNHAGYDMIVEDTGIGMSKEMQDKVFDTFVRAESATKSGVQGTGLGMSITKQLVEVMNGTIELESELGTGTKVTVHLDLRTAPGDRDDSQRVCGR